MKRLRRGARLVVASHNPGKVREIHDLVAPYGLSVVSASELDLPEPEETGSTFQANAELKALAAAASADLPALSDDSGLEVEVLKGAPGIYSARWAGASKDFKLAMQWVADEVGERGGWTSQGPRANFTAVLCLAWPDGTSEAFEGKVYGYLVWPPRGTRGFGYDPMFVADGETLTFGEMEPAAKHAISHRARAFAKFVAACLDSTGS
jgi:XTP/dITP diphosphohydrolase